MEACEKQKLKLLHLFSVVDGTLTAEEIQNVNAVYRALNVESYDRNEIEDYCNETFKFEKGRQRFNQAVAYIQNILSEGSGSSFLTSFFGKKLSNDRELQLDTIWSLINLGYCNKDYTQLQRQLVEYLVDTWEIKNSDYLELDNCAQTLYDLYERKDALDSDDDSKLIDKLDKDIKKVTKDIKYLIKESKDAIEVGE